MQEDHLKREGEMWAADKTARFLEHMQHMGAQLYLDGESVQTGARVMQAVQEEGNYMADYVFGPSGNVEEIRFDRIESW